MVKEALLVGCDAPFDLASVGWRNPVERICMNGAFARIGDEET
jgi:hypothetical protein